MNPNLARAEKNSVAENSLDFQPSAQRAQSLDRRMRGDLADSLRHVFTEAGGQLDVPEKLRGEFLDRVACAPVSPLAFSFFCDAILAIEDDDLDEASRLLRELIRLPSPSPELAVTDLADPATDALAQRYVRFIDTDPTFRFDIFAPSAAESEKCRGFMRRAFEMMDAGDAEQAAEIRALLREIVLASGNKDPKAFTFDGASSYMLWGGIVLNAGRVMNELQLAQMLVHESSHNLLFGLSADGVLVENSDDELYPSPLRVDRRPMDGIYHATFVSARMFRVVKQLMASGLLSAAQRQEAEKDLAENARYFAGGLETVNRHGQLTPTGRALIDGAARYMAGATACAGC